MKHLHYSIHDVYILGRYELVNGMLSILRMTSKEYISLEKLTNANGR